MSLQFNFKNHEPLVFQLDDDAELRFELSLIISNGRFLKDNFRECVNLIIAQWFEVKTNETNTAAASFLCSGK